LPQVAENTKLMFMPNPAAQILLRVRNIAGPKAVMLHYTPKAVLQDLCQ